MKTSADLNKCKRLCLAGDHFLTSGHRNVQCKNTRRPFFLVYSNILICEGCRRIQRFQFSGLFSFVGSAFFLFVSFFLVGGGGGDVVPYFLVLQYHGKFKLNVKSCL